MHHSKISPTPINIQHFASTNTKKTHNVKKFKVFLDKILQFVTNTKSPVSLLDVFQKFFTFPIAEKTEITNFADVTGAESPTTNL